METHFLTSINEAPACPISNGLIFRGSNPLITACMGGTYHFVLNLWRVAVGQPQKDMKQYNQLATSNGE